MENRPIRLSRCLPIIKHWPPAPFPLSIINCQLSIVSPLTTIPKISQNAALFLSRHSGFSDGGRALTNLKYHHIMGIQVRLFAFGPPVFSGTIGAVLHLAVMARSSIPTGLDHSARRCPDSASPRGAHAGLSNANFTCNPERVASQHLTKNVQPLQVDGMAGWMTQRSSFVATLG